MLGIEEDIKEDLKIFNAYQPEVMFQPMSCLVQCKLESSQNTLGSNVHSSRVCTIFWGLEDIDTNREERSTVPWQLGECVREGLSMRKRPFVLSSLLCTQTLVCRILKKT